VAIVTGRSLTDIRRRVGLREVIYAGNHGCEIQRPGFRRKTFFLTRNRKTYVKILQNLKRHLQHIPGVILEDKGATLSAHYRLIIPSSLKAFKRIFNEVIRPYLAADAIWLRKGKKVCEIRPPVPWDKGKAVSWLLRTGPKLFQGRKALTVYIGDDDTDEDVFMALKRKALTIRVRQSRRSAAQYYLGNTKQVAALLACVVRLREKGTVS
jgi:trehalose-phosphatase